MRILLIGPKSNLGIGLQTKKYFEGFSKYKNITIDWFGIDRLIFDNDEILEEATDIIKNVDFKKYDIINFHFGKLEAEQIIPYLLRDYKNNLPPVVLSVHSLYFDLFERTKKKDSYMSRKINESIKSFFDGYIYYGEYARSYFGKNGAKVFIHEQHHSKNVNNKNFNKFIDKFNLKDCVNGKIFTMIGYQSPWKDYESIIKALEIIKESICFIFAGEGWSNKISNMKVGNSTILVIDKNLNEEEVSFFLKISYCGCLYYKEHKSFQGSGVLSNYIYNGIPVIVSSVANLSEVASGSGFIIPAGNYEILGEAISKMLDNKNYRNFVRCICKNKYIFSIEYHIEECLKYFNLVIDERKNK